MGLSLIECNEAYREIMLQHDDIQAQIRIGNENFNFISKSSHGIDFNEANFKTRQCSSAPVTIPSNDN